MGSTVVLARSDLLELRDLRWRAAAAAALPDLHPWGWSTGLVDPAAVLALFPMFRLRPGLHLAAVHHRGPEGTLGLTWALPAGRPPLDPSAWPVPQEPGDVPIPDGARPDLTALLEGERSPWNLLCASLLQRELEELGGRGGHRKWGKHDLISVNPWRRLTAAHAAANREHYTEGQYWLEAMLDDLHPRVIEDGQRTRVVFYTVRREPHLPVYVHEDHFGPEGFALTPGRRLVGRVPYQKPGWAGDVDDPGL